MGNTPGKESDSRSPRSPASPSSATFASSTSESLSRHGRSHSGRHESSFLGLVGSSSSGAQEVRKETRQEREARKLARERAARLKERERSLREEHVDGGYLVTLGTYTGPEDFSKSTVRQLMIERRLSPFWRGLNDHSDSWTEHQLVAAAQGKPIPAPDEIPEDENLTPPPASAQASASRQTPTATGTQAVPVPTKAKGSNDSSFLSGSSSAASLSVGLSPSNNASTSPLFRGRAKTLASLASSAKTPAQVDMTPQEIHLPHEPFLNGMRIEAHLYKDVLECPICFLYYPPYLNKTRCCDQPICSECFVQIKRPDPHPPEHLDPNTPVPETPPKPEEENLLVSEPATCPFCVQAEFGVSYQPPAFRRGLAYAHSGPPMLRTNSAMSSASESSQVVTPVGSATGSTPARRRAESLSANAPSVITTDKVRPDWAKKLSDARAHQARRAAAATALHTAAYLMNNNQGSSSSSPFSRRRRAETTGSVTSRAGPDIEQLMAVLETRRPPGQERHGNSDLFPARGSSQRATNAQDLEELMLMEAIRLSIAAEEERQKKEEKEAAKQAKLDDKQKAKEQKKSAKKGSMYSSSANSSTMLPAQTGTEEPASTSQQGGADIAEDDAKGKERSSDGSAGQADAGTSAAATVRTLPSLTPLAEPSSTLNTEVSAAKSEPDAAREVDETDSSSSQQKLEQTFNFQSLAEMIGNGSEDASQEKTAGENDATAAGSKEQGRQQK